MKMRIIQDQKGKEMESIDDIKAILQKGMGVEDALSFGKKTSEHPFIFKFVLDIALTAQDKTADKAAWVIYKAVLECDCLFAVEFKDDLMEGICHRTLSPAVLRELLKVLLQLHPESHASFGLLFNRSQEWMFDRTSPAAIRYASLNVIELAGKKYPELIPECWEIIQTAKELAEGPWQRRCKKVQQVLDKQHKKYLKG